MQNRQSDLDKLVVIRAGLDGHQANLLKLNLEGQGVPAFLANEHVGSMNFVSNTDLFVRAKDWRAAEQALSKIELMPLRSQTLDADGEERACPHCGSHRVHTFVGEVPSAIPFLRYKADPGDQWFHCLECGSYHRAVRQRFAGLPIALAWSAFMGAVVLAIIFLINWLKYL